jgi:hypothetical protein
MSIVVVAHVSHGNYTADFVGAGKSVSQALDEAAGQSTYSSGIIDSNMYPYAEKRRVIRASIIEKLERGEEARDFGWVTFRRIA